MIQRIQSIYLLAAIIIQALIFNLATWHGESEPNTFPAFIVNVVPTHTSLISKDKIDAAQKSEDKYSTLNTVIIMLNTLLIITAVGCIFLFRNRKIQLLITRLLLLIGSCLIAFLFFNAEQGMELFNGSKHSSVFMAGVYLPIISLLLFYLAGNRIQKDEKLVRDADRLR